MYVRKFYLFTYIYRLYLSLVIEFSQQHCDNLPMGYDLMVLSLFNLSIYRLCKFLVSEKDTLDFEFLLLLFIFSFY